MREILLVSISTGHCLGSGHNGVVPFEPLRTDEKLDRPVKREDIDAHFMRGLTTFSIVSISTFLLIAIPFFVIGPLETPEGLRTACLAGGIPALILGLLGGRLGKVSGGTGSVAGALTVSAFLYMKLRQVVVFAGQEGRPVLDWDPNLAYIIPLAVTVGSVIVFFIATPRRDYSVREGS